MDEVHKLWGADGASGANIRVHIHLLRQKLDELGVSDLIHIVPPELGYVFGQRFQPIDPARPGVLSYAPAGLLLDPHTRTAQRGDRYLEISPTLYEYLQRFMQKPEQIVRRSELAIISAGPGRDPASNSLVHKNIHGLRQALVAGGEPSVIITVREVGWTLEVPGPKPSSTS